MLDILKLKNCKVSVIENLDYSLASSWTMDNADEIAANEIALQKDQDDEIKRNMYHQKVETGSISKMQYFMDVLKKLEGETRKPVEHVALVRKLCFASNNQYDVESGIFTRQEANDMIRKMLREASIYESKPGHYNRV